MTKMCHTRPMTESCILFEFLAFAWFQDSFFSFTKKSDYYYYYFTYTAKIGPQFQLSFFDTELNFTPIV